MITESGINRLIARLALMPFFPTHPEQHFVLSEFVADFAFDDDQLEWLGKRMLSLYTEWPGPQELRAVFCSKFRPRDGRNSISHVYLDGIPAERPELARPAALPPGHVVSADPEWEKKIRQAAARKRLIPPVAKKEHPLS